MKSTLNIIKKNLVKDYANFCKKLDVKILDVEENTIFNFDKNKNIKSESYNGKYYIDINENDYLEYFKEKYKKIDLNYIKNYFENSKFHDDSILFISLSGDNFENKNDNFYFKVKFTKKITFSILEAKNLNRLLQSKNNYLFMKIRKRIFFKYGL